MECGLVMKKILYRSFLAFCFIFLFCANLYALDNLSLLENAKAAKKLGDTSSAIRYYVDYIDSHAATSTDSLQNITNRDQYFLRNLLIAYSGLLDIYQVIGDEDKITTHINNLKIIIDNNSLMAKNEYRLADIYRKHGFIENAILLYDEIVSAQLNNPSRKYNKTFLRANRKLLEIYTSRNEDQAILLLLDSLKASVSVFSYDLRDLELVGSLLFKYGDILDSINVFESCIENNSTVSIFNNEHAFLRAFKKLTRIYHEHGDADSLARVSGSIPEDAFGFFLPKDLYDLGITYLKIEEKDRANVLFDKLLSEYPSTQYARKALFVKGRSAASTGDWESSIQAYSEYINMYPEPKFFALKAYSRLIDGYWARDGNLDLVQEHIESLVNIVNDVSDYETQLNLARDLKDKGYTELANATFDLGVSRANQIVSNFPDSYQALKARWLCQKYGYGLGKFDFIETHASETMILIEKLRSLGAEQEVKSKIDYVESQTFLYLAEIAKYNEEPLIASNYLLKFL